MYCANLFLFQSSLHIEVWDYDEKVDDAIDSFTIPLSVPLDQFNLSHSLTVQGKLEFGILTLNYGNLTTDQTTCAAESSTQPVWIPMAVLFLVVAIAFAITSIALAIMVWCSKKEVQLLSASKLTANKGS